MSKIDDDHYSITRAVPLGKNNFFFSVGMNFIKSQDYKKCRLENPIEKEILFWGDTRINLFISNLNQINAFGPTCTMKEPLKSKPRMPKLEYIPPPTEMERII